MNRGVLGILFFGCLTVRADLITTVMERISTLLACRNEDNRNMCGGEKLGDIVIYNNGILKISRNGGYSFKEEVAYYGRVVGMSLDKEEGRQRVVITALGDNDEKSLYYHYLDK